MRTIAYWLSLSLIFTIPWENLIELGPDGTITLGIGLGVAGFWLATVVATGRIRRFQAFHLVVYLFLLWNVLSIWWSLNVNATLDRVQTYAQLFIMSLILWDLYTTPHKVRIGLQAYVLGAYVSAISMIVNYLTGINESGNAERSIQRFTATGFNSDDIGIILVLGLPLAWYLAMGPGRDEMWRIFTVLNVAYIPLGLLGVALSGTRAALVASAPAMFYILLSLSQMRLLTRLAILLFLLAALFFLQPLIPETSLQRLATTGEEIQGGDLNGRVRIWRESLVSLQAYPIWGTGSGAFRQSNSLGKVAHNSFLSVLVETGAVGFLLFGTALFIVVRSAWLQPRLDAYFWLTVLIVWALGASTLSWEPRKQTWLFLSLVIVGAAAQQDSVVDAVTRLPHGISPPLDRKATL